MPVAPLHWHLLLLHMVTGCFFFSQSGPYAWKTSWLSIRIYNSQTSTVLNKDKDVWGAFQMCSLPSHPSTCHSFGAAPLAPGGENGPLNWNILFRLFYPSCVLLQRKRKARENLKRGILFGKFIVVKDKVTNKWSI